MAGETPIYGFPYMEVGDPLNTLSSHWQNTVQKIETALDEADVPESSFIPAPSAACSRNSPFFVPVNTFMPLTWNRQLWDTGYNGNPMYSTDGIIIRRRGVYDISARIHWMDSTSGTRFARLYRTVGSNHTLLDADRTAPVAGRGMNRLGKQWLCEVGDLIRVDVWQDSTGNRDVTNAFGGETWPILAATLVRPIL